MRTTIALPCLLLLSQALSAQLGYKDTPRLPGQPWLVHDSDRPRPRQITPGDLPFQPPSDAIVLFDGKDLSQWIENGRGPNLNKLVAPTWKIENGYFEWAPGSGDLISKEKFGDAQYHVEWSSPVVVENEGQNRGNSGVIIQGRYEIQVLDSWNNPTYADGQAGSIYGQWPPLVAPVKKPGEWNYYDIVFEAPKWEGDRLVKPAYQTVFYNGVIVHNRKEVIGRMAHRQVGTYAPHAPEEPLLLQDHGAKVRFRNIWVRRLAGYDQKDR